ncbi:hypothetical protein EJ08DRAFT_191362 [Tothia fuscella]|uniref:Pentatricopeptide repeat protein n=1 Tax=Tothia fuscella TaxID=1048955 RepID=A0A9P4NT61_9PEZI|nr:hypothetical protein EJ08DRAFT_191362 [Tothia fuscella]
MAEGEFPSPTTSLMQDFHTCMRRCLSAIQHERVVASHFRRTCRLYSGVSTASSQRSNLRGGNGPLSVRGAAAVLHAPAPKSQHWTRLKDGGEDKSAAPTGVPAGVHGHIQRELVWLKDPLKLADRTRELLAQDKMHKAYELVRTASKSMLCVTSWNALIDFSFTRGDRRCALDTFNEMKKRAQFPDAVTYTIIFRGLAKATEIENQVSKAIALYHGMSISGAKIPPNIIHTNAAINICARAHDMTALWSIVSAIPESGANSANEKTYTIIFNALKADAELKPTEFDRKTGRAIVAESTLLQARQLWAEIIRRWQAGELLVDDDLACSIGRLLLIGGRPQDWDDVLSLVEQTMNIRRQTSPLRSGLTGFEGDEFEPLLLGNAPRKATKELGLDAGMEFAPTRYRSNPSYVRPTKAVLSLVMEACEKMVLKKAAGEYWRLFTKDPDWPITPDSANCHTYLRILRTARASTESVAFIRNEMSHLPAEYRTYRIAMSTCVRNIMSPSVMLEAGELMDMMIKNLGRLDIRACIMWMELGLTSPNVQDTLSAIQRLGVKSQKTTEDQKDVFDLVGLPRNIKKGNIEEQKDAFKLITLMAGGISRVLKEGVVGAEQKDELRSHLKTLSTYISEYKGDMDESSGEVEERKRKRVQRSRTKEKITKHELSKQNPNQKEPAKKYRSLPAKFDFGEKVYEAPLGGPRARQDVSNGLVRYGSHRYITKRT